MQWWGIVTKKNDIRVSRYFSMWDIAEAKKRDFVNIIIMPFTAWSYKRACEKADKIYKDQLKVEVKVETL